MSLAWLELHKASFGTEKKTHILRLPEIPACRGKPKSSSARAILFLFAGSSGTGELGRSSGPTRQMAHFDLRKWRSCVCQPAVLTCDIVSEINMWSRRMLAKNGVETKLPVIQPGPSRHPPTTRARPQWPVKRGGIYLTSDRLREGRRYPGCSVLLYLSGGLCLTCRSG